MLNGKKITVGVTGGITAYKTADIITWLKANGADVQVAMTKTACDMIAPLTLQALSGQQVATQLIDETNHWCVPHIDIAACDLYLLMPATANIMAKAAHGIADELISASLLATTAPILCVASMNINMHANAATQHNINILIERGWLLIDSAKPKLADIDMIKNAIISVLCPKPTLAGKKVLVSAGPTHEYIDPISYIGNRSSGKMGYALAQAANLAGAEVVLVSGPVNIDAPTGVKIKRIVSANEMEAAINEEYSDTDIVIMAAAVADYAPAKITKQKIKKSNHPKSLELERTPDILAGLGKEKENRFLVGFAAETNDIENYAKKKLREKNLDLILANDVLQSGAGFDVDTNIITAYFGESKEQFPKMSKQDAATNIIELLVRLLG